MNIIDENRYGHEEPLLYLVGSSFISEIKMITVFTLLASGLNSSLMWKPTTTWPVTHFTPQLLTQACLNEKNISLCVAPL